MSTPTPQPWFPPNSRWQRLGRAYFAFILALTLGAMLSAPVLWNRVECFSELTIFVENSPADDHHLINWGRNRSRVEQFVVTRNRDSLRVTWSYRGVNPSPAESEIFDEMRSLGYMLRGFNGVARGIRSDTPSLLFDASVLSAILAGTQVVFLFLGWRGMKRRANSQPFPTTILTTSRLRGVVFGVIGGGVLIGLGEASELMTQWLGMVGNMGPWTRAATMPGLTKAAFLLFGAVGAPVAEEVFFRAYLLGAFRDANDAPFGLLFTSSLFAAAHLSDYANIPVIFCFGLVLGWLYLRTGSLVAPIVAHAVNNLISILRTVSE